MVHLYGQFDSILESPGRHTSGCFGEGVSKDTDSTLLFSHFSTKTKEKNIHHVSGTGYFMKVYLGPLDPVFSILSDSECSRQIILNNYCHHSPSYNMHS